MDNLSYQDKCDISASFQKTVVRFIIKQLGKALKMSQHHPKTLVVAGGVAANSELRTALTDFSDQHSLSFYAPPLSLCTDNAAMIAWVAIEHLSSGYQLTNLQTIAN